MLNEPMTKMIDYAGDAKMQVELKRIALRPINQQKMDARTRHKLHDQIMIINAAHEAVDNDFITFDTTVIDHAMANDYPANRRAEEWQAFRRRH
jgi:hypothetical protein